MTDRPLLASVLRLAALTIAALVSAANGGCSGGAGGPIDPASEPSPTAPSGDATADRWSGTWTSETTVSGSFVATFTRTGDTVTGEVSFTGSPCFAGGRYEGRIDGDELDGVLRAGDIRVEMRATLSATQKNGTYFTANAGACTGDRGTLAAHR